MSAGIGTRQLAVLVRTHGYAYMRMRRRTDKLLNFCATTARSAVATAQHDKYRACNQSKDLDQMRNSFRFLFNINKWIGGGKVCSFCGRKPRSTARMDSGGKSPKEIPGVAKLLRQRNI